MPKLYVVATPIGNLGDLSPRMREALENADLIAAEDTRVTMKLLNHFDIKKPTVSCHRHNEDFRAAELVERMLAEDLTLALTCDAGTPAVSDPGHILVAAAWEAGIEVIPVSGPSAAITAISASGFDSREFAFYGFLPREKKPLKEKLAQILKTRVPLAIVYESPHRVVDLTAQMAQAWPGSRLCVCCDLTKKFEKILRGRADEVLAQLQSNPNVEKGEYCIVADLSGVEVPEEKATADPDARYVILGAMLDGNDLDQACRMAAEAGFSRNEIYRVKLKMRTLLDDWAENFD